MAGLIGLATASVLPGALAPTAHAFPCPDAQVVFARGTTELPGVGPTGQAFVDALRSQIAPKSLDVYAVDYPAAMDFATAIDGIADARAHILQTVATCPQTEMVLGGFSQGAAVAGFVTANVVPDGVSPLDVPAPMPVGVAEHIAAVALFGKPSTRFMRAINDPTIVIGPSYVAKTVDLCVDDDLVCDPQGRSFSVHNQYAETGTVNRGAVFAAQRLQADWAADAQTSPAGAEPAPQIPPTASPLLFSAPAAPSEHLPSMPQTLSGPATTARPPEVPPAASATPFPD